MSKTFVALALAGGALLTSACTEHDRDRVLSKFDPETAGVHYDERANLTRDDFRNMAPAAASSEEKRKMTGDRATTEPPIPEVSQILVAPRPPGMGQQQLVSVTLTEDVPIKDVLIELARLADVDLELDAKVSGGVIYRARNKPFEVVIDRIAEQAGLRYTLENGVLKVYSDEPYIDNYSVDFLNFERSSENSVQISTNVLSAGEGSSDSLNTGSTTSISTTGTNDLWESVTSGIEKILQTSDGGNTETGLAQDTAASAATATAAQKENFYIINKQAGLVTVSANARKHRKINKFLNKLKESVSAQVLIEAKIVEVSLDETFESGIDWSTVAFGDNFDVDLQFGSVSDPGNFVALSVGKGADLGIETLVKLAETFGTARTLSSPRLHAVNNQQAVLTFAENKVYFEIDVERETDTGSATNQELLTVDSTVKTVPIGIILTIQPSIDAQRNDVTLSIRPTLSRVTGTVSDPAVAFLASQPGVSVPIENEIPVVEVRELDTILKARSGEVMVLGGLMEERTVNTERGVPYFSEIPIVGNAFKGKDKNTEVVEMVIFIKATIVKGYGGSDYDKDLYRKFTADPRPLAF